MDSFFRGAIIFFFLMLLMRLSGKRSFSQSNVFNAILLIVISEAASPTFESNDHSITDSLMIIATLIFLNNTMSYLKQYSNRFEKVVDNVPLLLIEHGKPIERSLDKSRVDVSDILASARLVKGIERLEQIKYAVLETDGSISIITYSQPVSVPV